MGQVKAKVALGVICGMLCLVAPAMYSVQNKNWPEIQDHYQRGRLALEHKDYAAAADQFRAILNIDPANASAHANLGIIAFSEKDYAAAAREFNAALASQPSLWNAKALLGMTELRLGKDASAWSHLNASFEHLSDARLKSEAGRDMIRLCYRSNNLEPCLSVLQGLLGSQPVAPSTLYEAYRIYTDLAARSLSKLVESAPDSPEVHKVLAQALASHDDFPGAIAQYEKALETSPGDAGIHYQLGLMTLSESQTPEALLKAEQQFNLNLQTDPADADSYYMLGEIEWLRSKPGGALKLYLRSLQLDPSLVDAHIAAGKALFVLGNPEGAVAQLVAAIRLDPRSEVAHYRLGQAYQKLGRLGDARREDAIFQKLRASHDPVRALFQQVEEQPVMHQTLNGLPQEQGSPPRR